MRPYEGGAAPAQTGTTPVALPSATIHGSPRRMHSSAEAVQRSSVVHRDDPLALFRGLKFALVFEVIAVALIVGACYAVSFLANHMPDLMLGACIVLLGILFGAMLAART